MFVKHFLNRIVVDNMHKIPLSTYVIIALCTPALSFVKIRFIIFLYQFLKTFFTRHNLIKSIIRGGNKISNIDYCQSDRRYQQAQFNNDAKQYPLNENIVFEQEN